MNNINVSFTLNEAQVLVQLIDLAVKSAGLNAAEAAVVLTRKIQDQMPQQQGESFSSGGSAGSGGDAGSIPSATFASFPSGPVTGP